MFAGPGGGIAFLAWRITGRGRSAGRLGRFMALLLALGPGLLVNLVLKEGTGRPRPAQTREYGGAQAFRAVGEFGAPDAGHSFPTGHASMGFCSLGLFVYLWPRCNRLALAFGALGATHGLLMGVASIAQGSRLPDGEAAAIVSLLESLTGPIPSNYHAPSPKP